ncbi:MAG: putative integral rane protein [Propionibacteriaceae bacterium]|jgi:hypothetical protein|nr:putative integral rane protein [Propionibacteriaceae bacterium]
MRKKTWSDLSPRGKTAILTLASVQISLAATAWADLATRPSEQVNGSKAKWAAIIAINFFGPFAYFRWGRRLAGYPSPAGEGAKASRHTTRSRGSASE